MRRIALINQKGGVGKTTSAVNLGAALARAGRRVVLIDLDPQANLSLHVDRPVHDGEPSIYSVLTGASTLAQALQQTSTPGLALVPSSIDLSGAELELANAYGRELLLREALERWESEARAAQGAAPADYVLIDCPPSLGLLAVNGLVAAREVLIAVQTEFFALQGMSRLMDVLQVLRRRLNPALETCGILPCLYDNRLKLAREVLAEVRRYFPGQVFARPIGKNVKLAEAPGYGQTIFEYAPDSPGAHDYEAVARELLGHEEGRKVASSPSTAAPPRAEPEAVPVKKPAGSARSTASPAKAGAQPKAEPAAAASKLKAADEKAADKKPVDKKPADNKAADREQVEKAPTSNGRKPRILTPRATSSETRRPAAAPKPATVATSDPSSAPTSAPAAPDANAPAATSSERSARKRGAARVVGDLSLD
jgi:chromosome partitioning protein